MKFGLICPPGTGDLNQFCTLGYELRQRGHQVTLFGLPDVEPYATAANLEFYPIGVGLLPVAAGSHRFASLREIVV